MTEEMLKKAFAEAAEQEIAEIESMEIDEELGDEAKRKVNSFYKNCLGGVNIPYTEV